MALSTYAALQASVASFLHRDDLTAQIPDFIRLAESDLQVRAKLSQWDTTATVSLTNGVGALPSDFAQAISITYGGGDYTLPYLPKAQFDAVAASAESGEPEYCTIRGSSLLVYPYLTGDVTLAYTARFTPLSDTATSNSLLTLFPDAYLHGTMMHANVWLRDGDGATQSLALFEQDIGRIKKYMADYKYPHGLQMRVA
jgi:hypothetical protein